MLVSHLVHAAASWWKTYIVEDDQRAIDTTNCVVGQSRPDTAHAVIYLGHDSGLGRVDVDGEAKESRAQSGKLFSRMKRNARIS